MGIDHDNTIATNEEQVSEFRFLTVDEVISIHEKSIRLYSPGEPSTIRDYGLLDSAVLTPQQTFDGKYLYPTLQEAAAAYLIGLVLNHAFENGNKRVAFMTCYTFLILNGYRLTLTDEEAYNFVVQVITHEIEREEIIGVIEDNIEPLT